MRLRRPPHLGELALDLAIIAGALVYIRVAQHYPADGRQIPTLVGYLALALGAVHLLGHLVPRFWAPTHDSKAAQPVRPGPADAGGEPPTAPVSVGDPRQVMVAMAWALGLLVGLYVVGYVIAMPVFFLAYFGSRRAWRTAVVSAVVMGAVTEGLFVQALAVHLPTGFL